MQRPIMPHEAHPGAPSTLIPKAVRANGCRDLSETNSNTLLAPFTLFKTVTKKFLKLLLNCGKYYKSFVMILAQIFQMFVQQGL